MRSAFLFFLLPAFAQVVVPTYHNDNARTGANLNEPLLSPANVKPGSFGLRFRQTVDGAVFAQALYLPSVPVAGHGLHNLVIVATGHGSLYAFDADDASGSNASPLWQTSVLDPLHGIEAVTSIDVNCIVVAPELAIVGTPVADPATLTLYVVSDTKQHGTNFTFRLHAFDITSGAERPGSPVPIQAPGFVPRQHKQRGALLLANGIVYVPFGSNCDISPYHGWLMAYHASTLSPAGVFNTTPNGGEGSFWNAGAGAAADSAGNIYHMSANGDFSDTASNYGDSFLKLSPAPSLAVTDFFTPFNQSYLNLNDIDVGSSGPLILPDETGNAEHPRLITGAGKEGRIYLLDRDHLGHAQYNIDSLAVQSLPDLGHSLFGSMAYFRNTLYIATEYSPLRAYPISNAAVASRPSSQSAFESSALGATPSISANGAANGIVWILPGGGAAVLKAYDASNLAHELYSSDVLPNDAPGGWVEFTVPTVADGKVFTGVQGALAVYGLLNSSPPQPAAIVNAASFAASSLSPGGLATLFGSGLSFTTAAASSTPLPISLADVQVLVNGHHAGLLYVSPGQINLQLPTALAPGPAQIIVTVSGNAAAPLNESLSPAAPGIFVGSASLAAALDDGDHDIDPTNPAQPGSTISVFLTGIGPLSATLTTGTPAPASPPATATLDVSATIGGLPATVTFAGLAPGYAGLAQVNLIVPSLPPGNYPIAVRVGSFSSNSPLLSVSGN